jgi:hypothetical protein
MHSMLLHILPTVVTSHDSLPLRQYHRLVGEFLTLMMNEVVAS